MKPDVIRPELERMMEEDTTESDLSAVDKRIGAIERQQRNLVDQLANLGESVAALVTEKLAALEKQRQQLLGEREQVLRRYQAWQMARERLADLEAHCASIAQKLDSLDYDQKRLALDALGVEVTVWRTGEFPRYEIEANLPLRDQMVSDTAG
jgi:site-specific DNA recombinase